MEILRTRARILDYDSNRVEYRGTMTVEYSLEHWASGSWEPIDPDEIHAYLETADEQLTKITELTIQHVDTGRFFVYFHATPDVCERNTPYFVSVYWRYAGQRECERVLVVVVSDVK